MWCRRWLLGALVLPYASTAFAQFPPPAALPPTSSLPQARAPYQPLAAPINISRLPDPPKMLFARPAGDANLLPPAVQPAGGVAPRPTPQPAASVAPPSALPDGTAPAPADTPLPYPESKVAFDAGAVTMKRVGGGWQVWAGPRPFRDFGDDEPGARDAVRVLRDLHPTEWASIGAPRPVVEYGLTNGRPAASAGFPRIVVPIDLRTARVEAIKGVWCLRDDVNILFNFGTAKADADQALAVVRRYGFNRVGAVGSNAAAPALTYFFVCLDADGSKPPAGNALITAAQVNGLARTGIPVPGMGYVGEMVKIDPRKAEVRRDGADWVAASGTEILARFGADSWAARDAVRVIQDGRFTEFCKVGAGGPSFFLVDGKAPTRVPLAAQGRRFDLAGLKTVASGPRWAVTEGGRPLFEVATADEGEAVVRLLRQFRFDQVCQIGATGRGGMTFLARSR